MFDIDVAGLAEIEGGKPPHRLAAEPITNVFDEFRQDVRKKPSYCAVTIQHSQNPRGVVLTVADDGAGFENEKDIYTLFGTTAKRSNPGVSGRFNFGDKQLIALAHSATVKTNCVTARFEHGERKITRHKEPVVCGTIVEALLRWTRDDERAVREKLGEIIPPAGLHYTIDGATIERPTAVCRISCVLPTVLLSEGVLRQSIRKTEVQVLKPKTEATLYELGIPVCSLADVGFPYSLDVQQKVPVPPSRDVVQPSYLYRLIGSVLEQAALDGHKLISEEQQGAGFVRDALEWVHDDAALEHTVKALCGDSAVRQSSDPIANAQAVASGATLVSGRWFGESTRSRLQSGGFLPTAKEKFGGIEKLASAPVPTCPHCGGKLN